jgi:hypothetical protein
MIISITWFDDISPSHHCGSNILTRIPGRSIRSIVIKRSVVLITLLMKFMVKRFLDLISSLEPLMSHIFDTTSSGGISESFLFSTALISKSRTLSIWDCSSFCRVLRQIATSKVGDGSTSTSSSEKMTVRYQDYA